MLEMFRVNITQKIFNDVIKSTKLEDRDVAIMGDLAELGTPLAKYSTLADGGTGFSVNKIKLIGYANKTIKDAAIEYNRSVDELVKRGTSDKGKELVSLDRDIINMDKDSVMMLRSIINRKSAAEGKRAVESLVDFVKTLDPTSTVTQSIKSFLHRGGNPDGLLNMMLGKGLIAPKKKKGIIEYVFNRKGFEDPINQKDIKDYFAKYGVHATDIQARMDAAALEIDSYIDMRYKAESGALTQQGFFDKYYPAGSGWGSKHQDVEVQNKILEDALYRVKKNGDPIVRKTPHINVIESMEFKVKDKNDNDITISGKELMKNKTRYSTIYKQVLDDAQRMLAIKHGNTSVPVLSVNRNTVVEKNINVQKNAFTKFLSDNEIPYVFVDGEIYSHRYNSKGSIEPMSINVFNLDSPANTAGFDKTTIATAANLKTKFKKQMDQYQIAGQEAEVYGSGVDIIPLGNAKHRIAVPKGAYEKVTELFKQKIYDRYLNEAKSTGNDAAVDAIEGMMTALNKLKVWDSGVHTDAMRSIVVNEMVSGKNVSDFLRIFNDGEALTNIGKGLVFIIRLHLKD